MSSWSSAIRNAMPAFLALALVISGFKTANAAQNGEVYDFSIYQPYLSVRALGMGNAYTAVADDYNTVLYNPAGLARIETPNINLGLGANIDSKVQKLKSDIDSASGDTTKTVNLLQENYGNHYSARLPTIGGFWVRPKWGVAVIPADLNLEIEPHQIASLSLIATQDTTIAYGRGWDVNWGRGRWSLGVTGKVMYRAYYNKYIPGTELAVNNQLLRAQDAKEGVTADADLGMLWTPKISETSWWRAARPTLGFVIRNAADYGFTLWNPHLIDPKTGQAPHLGRRFDLGSKFELPNWSIFKVRAMADLRDMGHENFTFQKGMHLGAEFLWKIRSWWQGGWRVGVSQGYFTAGFTGTLGMFTLDLATYADEVGPSDMPKASRRFALKASLDW